VLSDVNGRRRNVAHEKHPPQTSSLASSTTSALAQRPRGDVVRWDMDVVYAVTSSHGRVYTDGSLGVSAAPAHDVKGKGGKAVRRRRKQQVDATATTGDSDAVDGDGEAHARSGASADPANGDEEKCVRDGGVSTLAPRKDRSGHSVRKGAAAGGRTSSTPSSTPSSAPVAKRASATNRSSTAGGAGAGAGATAAPARKRKSKPVSPHQPTLAKWLAPKRSSPLVDV
jgi:hypothetical protein